MPSGLRPLMEEFYGKKEKFTVEFPFQPSRRWQQFFIKIEKTHLCFHCLRVTYVIAGVSDPDGLRFSLAGPLTTTPKRSKREP
jgi:hypothetical protein